MATLRAPHLSDVPGFFRWQCNNAENGEIDGYRQAGYELAGALLSVRPADCGSNAWDRELKALSELLWSPAAGTAGDVTAGDDAILAWFDEHFPACMPLVPQHQREQFLAGVLEAVDEGIIELG
jgi:hypothetical protein